jgi:hypothetical protein
MHESRCKLDTPRVELALTRVRVSKAVKFYMLYRIPWYVHVEFSSLLSFEIQFLNYQKNQ